MITIKNNVQKLKENKKELLDANAIINEQMTNVIKQITKEINKLSNEHDATVSFNGKITEFKVSITSESDYTSKLIQDLVSDLK